MYDVLVFIIKYDHDQFSFFHNQMYLYVRCAHHVHWHAQSPWLWLVWPFLSVHWGHGRVTMSSCDSQASHKPDEYGSCHSKEKKCSLYIVFISIFKFIYLVFKYVLQVNFCISNTDISNTTQVSKWDYGPNRFYCIYDLRNPGISNTLISNTLLSRSRLTVPSTKTHLLSRSSQNFSLHWIHTYNTHASRYANFTVNWRVRIGLTWAICDHCWF